MSDTERAASFAIGKAKERGAKEVSPNDLLLGCLLTRSQFGVFELGPWTLDLETIGIDWLQHPVRSDAKVAYSEAAVEIFDRAARIAKAEGAAMIGVDHLLAAFAAESTGLMGELKRNYGITSTTWRAAVARLSAGQSGKNGDASAASGPVGRGLREYLTPEQAAETLGVHVQTLRAYVRSGKLPALRLAGERAIRIRRSDLEQVLEPVQPESDNLHRLSGKRGD
jgi:excisionase family DNA binding protein